MPTHRIQPVDGPGPIVESLEGRRLLAGEPWGAFPELIGQDLAVANFASVTGAGCSVAVLDTGIDYRHPALGGAFGTWSLQLVRQVAGVGLTAATDPVSGLQAYAWVEPDALAFDSR